MMSTKIFWKETINWIPVLNQLKSSSKFNVPEKQLKSAI